MVEEGEDLITFIHQGSARSNNSNLIRRVLETIKGLHEPYVMIWLGTCDLTQKLDGGYISLNSVEVKDIIGHFRDFQKEIKSVNETAEILFLQCPVYSIKLWNKHKRHPNYETFFRR